MKREDVKIKNRKNREKLIPPQTSRWQIPHQCHGRQLSRSNPYPLTRKVLPSFAQIPSLAFGPSLYSGFIIQFLILGKIQVSKKSKRARRRKQERRARKNLELNKVESMADKPIANPQQNEAHAEKQEPLNFGIIHGNAPASTSQKQEKESPKKRNYRKYVIWPVVAISAIWAGIRWCVKLFDNHNATVTAAATIAIVWLTHVYVDYSKKQWQVAQDSLRLSQQAYVIIGRKDGKLAEFKSTDTPGTNAAVVLFFQNSGHLPAKFNWGTTTTIPVFQDKPRLALPGLPSAHTFVQMKRIRNRKDGSISESGATVIGGDSVYDADYGEIPKDRAKQVLEGGNLFMIEGAFESCDEMGIYSCKTFSIFYQGHPYDDFRLV